MSMAETTSQHQLEQLIAQARELLGAEDEEHGIDDSTIGMVLHHAHHRVAADLDHIERLHNAGETLDLPALLGATMHEKLATILFLARYTLLDLACPPEDSLDIDYAHRDSALYTEILYRTNASGALEVLYDFAAEQQQAHTPDFWQNICLHCIFYMAVMPDAATHLTHFLHKRPAAVPQLGHIITCARPEVAAQLRQLLAVMRSEAKNGPHAMPVPPYLHFYHQLEDVPYDGAWGTCALVAAQHRIRQSFNTGDLEAIKQWFATGSTAAVREIFHQAHAVLPPKRYAYLLEEFLNLDADPVRLTGVVLELGNLNLSVRPEGGQADINRVLIDCAMREDTQRLGVARVAVSELVTVRNQDAIVFILQNAKLLPVAEQAVVAMKELRRLRAIEPIIAVRPELRPAFRAAHQQLLEIQNLVEMVWSSPSTEMANLYVEQLKTLKAYPELDRLSELARSGNNRVFG